MIGGAMNPPPEQDPEKVAQLQQQLADAEAQIAAVKAQLQGVTGQSGDPGVHHPIVIQGGAVDQHGNPVDLAQMLGTERSEQLRDALSQLGLGNAMVGFGAAEAATPAPPAELLQLVDPPRHVPFTFRIAAFAWSWYEGFGVFIGVIAPIALWGFFPWLIPAGFLSGIALILYIRGGKAVRRLGLVKQGKVATVTNYDELSRGTYYSGMTYSNMWVTQAHGWDVTRRMYSGPGSKTRIDYSVDGATGSFVLRGLPYAGGVVLAHPRRPSVALCVNQFVYDVKPDADGQMVGGLRAWTWVGIPFTLLMELGLVAGAVYSVSYFWM
jgi:hypothetical protein